MQNKNLILVGLFLLVQGCASTSIPEGEHIKTTKKITNLEQRGNVLEEEGKELLDDLSKTLNQSIN